MNKKLNLVALWLSIVAFLTSASILLLGYYTGNDENNLILLVLTGVSSALISINLANYRRSRKET